MLDCNMGWEFAGVVPIAHNSGGPKADIVSPPGTSQEANGFLCSTAEEYAEAITRLLCMDPLERQRYAGASRRLGNVLLISSMPASLACNRWAQDLERLRTSLPVSSSSLNSLPSDEHL